MKENNFLLALKSKNWVNEFGLFTLFLLLTVIFRLPHILSRNFYFDGDEAIIGVMAQDLLDANNLGVYFYGQNYGFSLFEVLSVAFWLKIFGAGIWALRMGGYTLFALSAFYIWKGLKRREVEPKRRWVCVIIFLTFPTWMLWGGMVRGGYVTALLGASVLYYLSAEFKWKWKYLLLFGFWLAVSFESHFLILVPLLPLLLKEFLNQKGKLIYVLQGLFFTFAWIIAFKFLNFNHTFWHAPNNVLESEHIINQLINLFKGFMNSYGDFFYYTIEFDVPSWWLIGLCISFILYLALIVILFYKTDKKWISVLWILALAAILMFSATFFFYSPRYLIGLFTGILFFLLFHVKYIESKRLMNLIYILAIVQFIGIFSGSKMKREWYDTSLNNLETLDKWHDEVENRGIKAVFITDNLIQWQWNFLFGKDIPACAFRRVERTNTFSKRVYEIYEKSPQKTAIVGLWGLFLEIDYIDGFNDKREQVAEKYFIMQDVQPKFLEQGEQAMSK